MPDDANKTIAGAVTTMADSVIDSMKTQPLMMGMLILNVVVLGFVYFGQRERNDQLNKQFMYLYERCLPQKQGMKDASVQQTLTRQPEDLPP